MAVAGKLRRVAKLEATIPPPPSEADVLYEAYLDALLEHVYNDAPEPAELDTDLDQLGDWGRHFWQALTIAYGSQQNLEREDET